MKNTALKLLALCAIAAAQNGTQTSKEPGLLFYLSGDHGLTADYAAGGDPVPSFQNNDVRVLPGGAHGPYIQCGDKQVLAYWAPGNIYAQRGTLSFYWRSRYPVGKTEFPVFRVARFTEKPELDVARQMVASGKYSWNSGMFVWRVDRILEEFQSQMPNLYAQLMDVKAGLGNLQYKAVLLQAWSRVAEQTIDYGVMEHAKDVAVIPIDIGWTDVGSWASLAELLSPDQEGNIFVGPYKEIDTHNTLVFGRKRLIATIGIQDIVIIDSEDALLVCAKQREQEVRGTASRTALPWSGT